MIAVYFTPQPELSMKTLHARNPRKEYQATGHMIKIILRLLSPSYNLSWDICANYMQKDAKRQAE